MKIFKNIVYAVKRQIYGLNIEKILLLASILAFYLILLSLRESTMKSAIDISRKDKTLGIYKERLMAFFSLPREFEITKQKISGITLADPQTILSKEIVSKDEKMTASMSRNPFFYEDAKPLTEASVQNAATIVNTMEELTFVGIIDLTEDSGKLSIILNGVNSGRYMTCSEGDTWNGITVISVSHDFARIKNRNGDIHDYTTSPGRSTVK